MDIRILHQIRMGFIVFTETAAILARMKTIRKGFRAWNHPMLAHYRLNIAHLSTTLGPSNTRPPTLCSTGGVELKFESGE